MPPRNVVDRERIRELARAGTKIAVISRRLAISQWSVYRALQLDKRRKRPC